MNTFSLRLSLRLLLFFIVALADFTTPPVSAQNRYFYWTESNGSAGIIRSMPIGGGAITDIATAPTQFNGIDFTANTIVVTGGPASALTVQNPAHAPFVLESSGGYDTTLYNGIVYFTDGASAHVKTNIDDTIATLLTNDRHTFGIKVYNDQIYFSELGSSSGGSINRMDLDGGNLITLIDNVRVYDFEIYNGQIYYGLLDFPGGIRRSDLAGTNTVTLLGDYNFAYGLEVDATGIYWSTYPNAILQSDLDGSNVTTLLSGLNGVRGITIVDEVPLSSVPEPSTATVLVGSVVFGFVYLRRRRRR